MITNPLGRAAQQIRTFRHEPAILIIIRARLRGDPIGDGDEPGALAARAGAGLLEDRELHVGAGAAGDDIAAMGEIETAA